MATMATAWRDLALDTSGDLLVSGGDFVLLQGNDAIVQECQTALGLYTGEYPFDTTIGTAWPVLLNQKGVTDAQLSAEIRRVLSTITGVASIDSIQIARDTTARTAAITVYLTTDSGAALAVPLALPGGV
jgi:hypothetical protein